MSGEGEGVDYQTLEARRLENQGKENGVKSPGDARSPVHDLASFARYGVPAKRGTLPAHYAVPKAMIDKVIGDRPSVVALSPAL